VAAEASHHLRRFGRRRIPVAGRAIDSGSRVLVDQVPMAAARRTGRLGGSL